MSIFVLAAAAAAAAPLASATLPLPPELRASASSVSMDRTGIHTLRKGTGKMVCIADAPGDDVFDVRCYHRDFIPYFYRLQQLSAEGVPEEQMDARIEKELKSGTLHMRMQPSAGYRMYGPITALTNDGTVWTEKMTRWQSIHIPRATAQDMGLVTDNKPLMPYVMASGSLWAHVMINSPAE
jgi:hypothetical protein